MTSLRRQNVIHMAVRGRSADVMRYLLNELQQKGIDIKALINVRESITAVSCVTQFKANVKVEVYGVSWKSAATY
jgi:hypothetical protein